jgi:hypothetical protein
MMNHQNRHEIISSGLTIGSAGAGVVVYFNGSAAVVCMRTSLGVRHDEPSE